jgi:nucleolar protein 14
LDRRFGEKDETLGDADRAIIRFQRRRQARMLKSNKYALSDGEDDILTHHGAALSTLDDFEDEIVEDDDDGTAECTFSVYLDIWKGILEFCYILLYLIQLKKLHKMQLF